MLIDQMIRELRMQKRDLERAIELLETFERDGVERRGYNASNPGMGSPQPRRRGRKFMTMAERLAVSERMKLYWSARKREENQRRSAPSTAASASTPSESRPGTRP